MEVDWINLCHVKILPNNPRKSIYTDSQHLSRYIHLARASTLGFGFFSVFLEFSLWKIAVGVHCCKLLSCLSMKMLKAHIHTFMLSYSLFNYHCGWFVTVKQFWESKGFETAQNANVIISPFINGRHDTHLNHAILSLIIKANIIY